MCDFGQRREREKIYKKWKRGKEEERGFCSNVCVFRVHQFLERKGKGNFA